MERVNAELHELIEKYEAEFFSQQVSLEADKATALAQARALQDEVMKLQERMAAVVAAKDTDTMDQGRRSVNNTLRGEGVCNRVGRHKLPANDDTKACTAHQVVNM